MKNSSYSKKDLLAMSACTNCRLCAEVCPAVLATKDGRLSGIYRLDELKKINRKRYGLMRRLAGKSTPDADAMKPYSETVFRCTLCGSCQEVCPVGIHLKDIWLNLRQDLVHSKAYPGQIDRIRNNLFESHNVFDEDNEERAEWVEDAKNPPENGYIQDEAEVVYFTGCVAAYFPMVQKIPMALAEIFTAAGVDFTLLGEDEWCCGFPLLGAGLKDKVSRIIEHNVAAIRRKKAETVVFACPSCYQMWREYYPNDFNLYHVTRFLHNLIEENRIPLKKNDITVTYHDPCDLGRGAREFDAPREVIRRIPGVKLVEMEHNRENCRCCGGGGNLEMIDAELAAEIAGKKIEEILKTGAEAVVTSCQQCVRTMTTYVRRNKIDLKVMDITELIKESMP
ncbi:MAG: (Fe-S)-binding protein [Desulfobacterales bacterium]